MKFPNPHFTIIALISVVISFYVSSCASSNNSSSNNQPAVMQSPVSTLTVQDVESIINSENYLKECRLKYPIVNSQQIGFLEVYPGITTKDELIAQLGQPNKFSKTDQVEEYLYFDASKSYAYHFYVTKNVVSDISIGSDIRQLDSLKNILEKYGCPDLVIAELLSDDPFAIPSEYNTTYFQYLKAGLWIRFEGYPINYSDMPTVISFEKPLSLISFLELRFNPQASKVVPFSEAIVH